MGGDYSGMPSISDTAAYEKLKSTRRATSGVSAFTHTEDIKRGRKSASVHERLDPSKVKDSVTGKRESRDIDGVESNAIAVFFDETGSMGGIPVVLQTKLAKLMSAIKTKDALDNPQVLFGCFGDAYVDRGPFQVGQFETDLAADEDLDKFWLEGGGGGGNHESYELPLYFLSRMTSIDCHEKRGKKGYAFIIGDEAGYTYVSKDQVKKIFDTPIQENIPLEDIITEAQEKYNVFFIVANSSTYGTRNKSWWINYFGQNTLVLDNPDLVCELIVTTIAMNEGVIEEASELSDELGLTTADVNVVTKALAEYKGGAISTEVTGGELATADSVGGLDE